MTVTRREARIREARPDPSVDPFEVPNPTRGMSGARLTTGPVSALALRCPSLTGPRRGRLCAYAIAAAELDGGRDELAIDVTSGGATGLVEFYRVDLDGALLLVIAEPGDPQYVEPGPAILGGGFDSGLQSPIECCVTADGTRELVSIHAENVGGDSLSGPWQLHRTTMTLRDYRLVVTSTSDSERIYSRTSEVFREVFQSARS